MNNINKLFTLLFIIFFQPISASTNVHWVSEMIKHNLNKNTLLFLNRCRPNEVKKEGISLLMMATRGNQVSYARNLINLTDDDNRRIIDVNEQTIKGSTALHIAVIKEDPRIFNMLIVLSEIDVDRADKNNVTPVHLGAQNGNLNTFKKLLKKSNQINKVTIYGNTPLMLGSMNGHTLIVKHLVNGYGDSVLLNIKNNNGKTAFDIAKEQKEATSDETKKKDYQTICDTLESAYYERVFDFFDAIYEDNFEKIKQLSQSPDLNPNAINPYNGATLLMFACYVKATKAVEVLLREYGADPNIAEIKYGSTPLMLASERGAGIIVQLLLRYKAKVNQQDSNLNTALIMACCAGHIKVVELLLNCDKINIYLLNRKAVSAIAITAEKGHTTILRKLLTKSDATHLNQTMQAHAALIAASYYQQPKSSKIVKKLLKCDKIDWYDKGKMPCLSAFIMAYKNNRQEVIAVFRNHFSQNRHGSLHHKSTQNAPSHAESNNYDKNKVILAHYILNYSQ